MENQKKQFESQMKLLRQSMTEEIEDMTSMFADTSKDIIKLTIEHRELQKKFNEYYQKTDTYIKDRE